MSNQASGGQQVEELALTSQSPVTPSVPAAVSSPSSPAVAASTTNNNQLLIKLSSPSLTGSSTPQSPAAVSLSIRSREASASNSPRQSAPSSPRQPDGIGTVINNQDAARPLSVAGERSPTPSAKGDNGVETTKTVPRPIAAPPSAGPSKSSGINRMDDDITTCEPEKSPARSTASAVATSPAVAPVPVVALPQTGLGTPMSVKSGGTDSALGNNGEYNNKVGCFRLRNNKNATSKKGKFHSDSDETQQMEDSDKGCKIDAKKCLFWCCCCACTLNDSITSVKSDPNRPSKEKPLQVSPHDHYFAGDNEPPPTLEDIRAWGESFDKLLKSAAGRKVFRDFLKIEYSEENIVFWLACEDLKTETNPDIVEEKARLIYEDYISILSPREVSLDSRVREIINKNMVEPSPHTFDEAQLQIYTLMHRDSYGRFIISPIFKKLAQLPSPSRKGSAA